MVNITLNFANKTWNLCLIYEILTFKNPINESPNDSLMNKSFVFELPPQSKSLTDKEYVNLVNRIRGNFLSYVSVIDTELNRIIAAFFLRDLNDSELWFQTVFYEDRTSFGSKIVWISRIMASHDDFIKEIPKVDRLRIQKKLSKMRCIRNEFAHNSAYNKKINQDNVKNRVIELHDFKNGKLVPKLHKMQEIMNLITDCDLPEQFEKLLLIVEYVRK